MAIETKSFKVHASINRFVRGLGASTVCLPELLPSIVNTPETMMNCELQNCTLFYSAIMIKSKQFDWFHNVHVSWLHDLSLLYILSDLCCFVHYFCCSCYSHVHVHTCAFIYDNSYLLNNVFCECQSCRESKFSSV